MKIIIHPKFLPLQKEGGYNRKNKILSNKLAFTLVEIMVWILIVSMILIWWFQALSAVTIWKAKLIQKVDMQKESFYFTEKLFEMVKEWWTLDYEEYFNRSVIWNTLYSSWHYNVVSWLGNYWKWWSVWSTNYGNNSYECISIDASNIMTWTGCVTIYNSGSTDYTWEQQRYWEYNLQFIDYNSNYDSDLWDENGDWNIKWDDDDEFIWDWPIVFSSWTYMPELYLLSWNKQVRTYFRWSVNQDPNATTWNNCTFDSNNNITGSWCLWTVEYIRLLWKDWWIDHDSLTNDSTQNDWIIDTWIIDPEINWWAVTVAWSWIINWIPLFSDAINVSEFKIYSYPNKDLNLAWKNADKSINVSPYTLIKIKLKPSWLTKRKIWWDWEELDFSMTINLSDMYSQ